jgi:Arginine repressor
MKTKPHPNTLFDVLQTLLTNGQVGTQEEIIKALTHQGFVVSQSKVSRLLKRMAAIKINTQRGSIYRLPHQHDLAHEFSDASKKNALKSLVLQVSANETLIVVRTMPGGASLVARTLDQEQKIYLF